MRLVTIYATIPLITAFATIKYTKGMIPINLPIELFSKSMCKFWNEKSIAGKIVDASIIGKLLLDKGYSFSDMRKILSYIADDINKYDPDYFT